MGDRGAIASPAAVVNAVADALAPLGVKVSGSPLGPNQVLDMVAAATPLSWRRGGHLETISTRSSSARRLWPSTNSSTYGSAAAIPRAKGA